MTIAMEMTRLTALILCGGMGTRIRPAIGDLPKALARVAGDPYLHHMLTYLQSQSVTDAVLCTGYGADEVASYCGDGSRWGMRLRYSVEDEPLGTGGAIKHAEELIDSDPFLVLNGDSLIRADVRDLLSFHKCSNAQITLVLTQVPDKTRFGSALLAQDGSILGFSEKGQHGPGLINAGIYAMNRGILDVIPRGRNASLELDILPGYAGRGMYGMPISGSFVDIGTPESYGEAHRVISGWKERELGWRD
jgi:D-glycero-alpha-D-manno-heptose 1-phosphate guanylyltransferase